MLKVKQLPVGEIHRAIFLFHPLSAKNYTACLPLVDSNHHILSGNELINSQQSHAYCFILENAEQHLKTIIQFQESLIGRKLTFFEKIFFSKQITFLYPNLNSGWMMEQLEFAQNKSALLQFYQNMDDALIKKLELSGIHSLREAEYFYEISRTGFDKILTAAEFNKNQFRLALNAAFELYKTGRLTDFSGLNPLQTEEFLNSRRYPHFFKYLKNYQEKQASLKHPKNIKISAPPFFEGNKLTLELELKNTQQLEEAYQFLSKEIQNLKDLLQFINT